MNKKAILAFFIVILWMLFFYHPAFLHPNDYIFGLSGDAIKNYSCFAGHIKNDSSYLVYENMNYPYQLDYIYTDGNFLLGNTLKFLSGFSPWFSTYSIGIYNSSILFSLAFCAFFLALIFSRLRLPAWYIVLASVGIALLSPQIFRIMGHTTLAYTCFIPMSWWLFIRYTESGRKMLYASVIAVHLFLWYFVHPYLPIIFIIFLFFYFLIRILTVRPYFRIGGKEYSGFLIMTVVPLLLTQLFMKLTEHHTGRPLKPYGFWECLASFKSVFTPDEPPLGPLFKGQFGFTQSGMEGRSYIGLVCVFIAMFCVYRLIRFIIRKNFSRTINPVAPQWLRIAVLASIPVLLYSMAFPFRLHMEFLMEWFNVIRQFRAVGRFTWIFYYVFDVFAFYLIWQMFRYIKMKGLKTTAYTFISLVFITFFAEAYYHQVQAAYLMEDRINYFNPDRIPKKYAELVEAVNKVKKDYQCFLPLPFFHIGTDNFTTTENDEALRMTFIVNYYTGFPTIACCSARVPIHEGKKIMEFISLPYIDKPIQKDLPDKKNFLVIYIKGELDQVDSYWLSRSKKLWENESYELWELKYDDVFEKADALVWKTFDQQKDSLQEIKDGWLITKPGFFHYDGFDSLQSDIRKRGNGGFTNTLKNYGTWMDRNQWPFEENRTYTVSFWAYNKGEEQMWWNLVTGEEDQLTRSSDWTNFYSGVRSKLIDGDWSFVEGDFKPKNVKNVINFFIPNDPHSNKKYWADEFMIRPSDADVYKIVKTAPDGRVTEMIKNNIYFTRN
jgi:hypothetical protein